MKQKLLIVLILIFLSFTFYLLFLDKGSNKTNDNDAASRSVSGTSATVSAIEEEPPVLPDDLDSILDHSNTVPLDTTPSSYTVLVTRYYLLPASYSPVDLVEPDVSFSFSYSDDKRKLRKVAATALEKLFRAAKKKNINLYGVSGYRSYERQKKIYDRNIALHGKKETDKVSAIPGSSEHQTGLTIDVSAPSVDCLLNQNFGATKEGRWLAKNAHKYGYIVRYPDKKTKVTGYQYEPWHIRYVGENIAAFLYENNLTLEEYYSVNSYKEGKVTGVDVEDPDELANTAPKSSKNSKKK